MIKTVDIYWLAGFLEGEGCFGCYNRKLSVRASQVQKWPLEKCRQLVAGPFYRREAKGNANVAYQWAVEGRNAAGLMMTVYALMSPKRKAAIRKALKEWRQIPIRRGEWFHCPQGHAYTKANTILQQRGKSLRRRCRVCEQTREKTRLRIRRQSVRINEKQMGLLP